LIGSSGSGLCWSALTRRFTVDPPMFHVKRTACG